MERQTLGIFLRIFAVLSLTGSLITVTAKVTLSLNKPGKPGEFSQFSCSKIVKLPLISDTGTRGLSPLSISNYNSIIANFNAQIFARQLVNHYLNRTPVSEIEVIIFDESGKELARSKSSALLGNPLKVVFWIKNQLQQQRKFLKKGDLLSLGSITPMLSVVPGKTIYARYFGLTSKQPIEIYVRFY